MFDKPLTEISYEEIEYLVNVRQENEGLHLDYKLDIRNPDKAKKELAKDVSAFANSSGGYIIFGIDNDRRIVGIDKTIQNKPVIEWLNQVLSSNIEPSVFYFDPKAIDIPDSEKQIVILRIPESSKKPHIVTEWNQYYIRINDSSKLANHNLIRDMFDVTRNRTDEFIEFLTKRNLTDEASPDFGKNSNSRRLYSEVPEKLKKATPLVLYSLIPKFLNDEKINFPFAEFHQWLEQNSKGYAPSPDIPLFYGHYEYDLKIDGVVLKHSRNTHPTSYFEISNNGFVEAGLSTSVVHVYSDQRQNPSKLQAGIDLTFLICYEMMFLGFAKKFYQLARYFDEVFFQISFANMLDVTGMGLHESFRGWHGGPPANKQHNSFKLTFKFLPQLLSDDSIKMIAKAHSDKICRAFGMPQDYVFVNDEVSKAHMRHFYL